MKFKTFNNYVEKSSTEEFILKESEGTSFDLDEVKSMISKLTPSQLMTLRDEYGYTTLPDIGGLSDKEIEDLDDLLSVYFFTTIDDLYNEIRTLDVDELDEFGVYLNTNFFDDANPDDDDLYDFEDVKVMVDIIVKDKNLIGILMDLVTNGVDFEEDVNEGVSRILTNKKMNKKKRKFMTKSAAQLRREKSARTRDNRAKKSKKKRYYTANKTKIKSYQKSRKGAIDKGKHKVKKRRKA